MTVALTHPLNQESDIHQDDLGLLVDSSSSADIKPSKSDWQVDVD